MISIITKSAKDTHGVLATGGGGTFERGFGSLRIGGAETGVSYRAYGMYSDRAPPGPPMAPTTPRNLGKVDSASIGPRAARRPIRSPSKATTTTATPRTPSLNRSSLLLPSSK